MIREVIAATDQAVTDPVQLPRNFNPGAVISVGALNLNGSEKVVIWERFEAGGEWQPAYQWGQASVTPIEITETSGSVDIANAARRIGVTKTATMYPVPVYAISQDLIGT